MDKIEIYSSKKKSILLLIASIAFVALGLWLIINADKMTGWRANNPIFTRGIGILNVLFFSLGIFIGIKRLIKSEMTLIIDSLGVNVNPRKSLTDFIKWEEIIGFEEIKIQSTKILIIRVKNPDYWVEKETSRLRKKLMKFNLNNYNSPFNIAASGLDISSRELKEVLNRYAEKYKNAT